MLRERQAVELTTEHQAAHDTDLTNARRRLQTLAVCLGHDCPGLASRLEDGVQTSGDACQVLEWAVRQALRTDVERRLVGRLLGGISLLIRRTEDPELARTTYERLQPRLVALGRCTTRRKCGRCLHEAGTCRFDQIRYALVSAYLHVSSDRYEHPELGQAARFLPLNATGVKRGRGRPAHGWYQKLVKAGELDAAGYGAVLAAEARREVADRAWAQRTLERAWTDGSRNPRLANVYASKLERGSAADGKQHLQAALKVVQTTRPAHASRFSL